MQCHHFLISITLPSSAQFPTRSVGITLCPAEHPAGTRTTHVPLPPPFIVFAHVHGPAVDCLTWHCRSQHMLPYSSSPSSLHSLSVLMSILGTASAGAVACSGTPHSFLSPIHLTSSLLLFKRLKKPTGLSDRYSTCLRKFCFVLINECVNLNQYACTHRYI